MHRIGGLLILTAVGHAGLAYAGQKSVADIPTQAAAIAHAVTERCHAATGDDAEAYFKCRGAQIAALDAILDDLTDSGEAYALADCAENSATWEEVDWVWAWNCMQ